MILRLDFPNIAVPQLVSHAAHGLYLYFGTNESQLLSGEGQINLHIIIFCLAFVSPDSYDQLFPGEYLSLIDHHIFQQLKLFFSQTDALSARRAGKRLRSIFQLNITIHASKRPKLL